jgi:endonuclease G
MARRRSDREIAEGVRQFQRLDRRAQVVVMVVILMGALAWWGYHYWKQHHPQTAQTATAPIRGVTTGPSIGEVNLLLGNPSGATSEVSNRNNYLMVKPYYALSYNEAKGTPNWVSWRVARADLGKAMRKREFDPDETLPRGFKRVTHRDYFGGGFDRGHLCPHSDRAASEEMSFATFVMTNIVPQAPNVNQRAWAHLEEYCRNLVEREHDRLYIVSGPAGIGGVGKEGKRETIADGKVTVPAECWKIVVVVPERGGEDDYGKISAATRVITVLMPNDDTVGNDWKKFTTTAGKVEVRTGLKFFDRLAPDVAEALRVKADGDSVASGD